jgi:Uma2 family endonuclease
VATTIQKHEAQTEMWTGWPVVLRLRPAVELSEDEFFELCQINRELWIERNAEGELLIMPPAGWETGDREAEITVQVRTWAKRDGTGVATSPSAGFRLPNTAIRAPDAAWIRRSRLAQISPEQRQKFIPACPDFVIELRSPNDTLRDLQNKMQEYIDNGAQLGWLIDRRPRHVYVYRPSAPVERLDNPESVSGDPVLPGFSLNLREIW